MLNYSNVQKLLLLKFFIAKEPDAQIHKQIFTNQNYQKMKTTYSNKLKKYNNNNNWVE